MEWTGLVKNVCVVDKTRSWGHLPWALSEGARVVYNYWLLWETWSLTTGERFAFFESFRQTIVKTKNTYESWYFASFYLTCRACVGFGPHTHTPKINCKICLAINFWTAFPMSDWAVWWFRWQCNKNLFIIFINIIFLHTDLSSTH